MPHSKTDAVGILIGEGKSNVPFPGSASFSFELSVSSYPAEEGEPAEATVWLLGPGELGDQEKLSFFTATAELPSKDLIFAQVNSALDSVKKGVYWGDYPVQLTDKILTLLQQGLAGN